MRIISGLYKSRKIYSPDGDYDLNVRPTSDRARESVFNILHNIADFNDMIILDLFAGTGVYGFESLSRGASFVYFVDTAERSSKLIKKTTESLGCTDKIEFIKSDAITYLLKSKRSYDIIFADPPYDYEHYEQLIKNISETDFQIFLLEYENETMIDFAGFDKEIYDIMHRIIGRSAFKLIIKK